MAGSSIGWGLEANAGPLIGGATHLTGSSTVTVSPETLDAFGLRDGTTYGSLTAINGNTHALQRSNGDYTVFSYGNNSYVKGGAILQKSLSFGFSGFVTFFNDAPSNYDGEFITAGVQYGIGVSASWVPGTIIPASVSLLFGPQFKLQLPSSGTVYAEIEEYSPQGVAKAAKEVVTGVGEAISGIAQAVGNAVSGFFNAIGSIFSANNNDDEDGSSSGKPIIIDLDGDGIEVAPIVANPVMP